MEFVVNMNNLWHSLAGGFDDDFTEKEIVIRFMFVPSGGQILATCDGKPYPLECFPLQEMDTEELVQLGKTTVTMDMLMKSLRKFVIPAESMVKLTFNDGTITITPSFKLVNQMDVGDVVL